MGESGPRGPREQNGQMIDVKPHVDHRGPWIGPWTSDPSHPTTAKTAPGALRVASGAALFAVCNCVAVALYRRGGASVISLFVIRSPVVFLANGTLVYLREGRESAIDVLLLRTGSREATRLALLQSLFKSASQLLVCIAFVFLTYADAFTVFKGVSTISTVLIARVVLGRGESIALHELASGFLILTGIILIAQPPALFGHPSPPPPPPTPPPPLATPFVSSVAPEWAPRATAGLALAALSGCFSSGQATLMRLLSRAGGPHDGCTPPAMLFSFMTAVFFVWFGGVHLACRLGDLSERPAWRWSAFTWPSGAADWALVGVNCACNPTAWLLTAAGYQDTRAGTVAFLQLTELPWVYLLDTLLLDEPTNAMATLGCAAIFSGALSVLWSETRENRNGEASKSNN